MLLSYTERELVRLYRSTPPEGQDMILTVAKTAQEVYSQKNNESAAEGKIRNFCFPKQEKKT
jgi:hypothetical protein